MYKKHLIFYWYIPDNGVWHSVYDLHIRNLFFYRGIFDKVTFVLSHNDCGQGAIDNLKSKISAIFGEKVNFAETENNREYREAKYFYENIVSKMSQFDNDEIIFFAHNKGVASNYVTKEDLNYWINIMYFSNLFNINDIERHFNQGAYAVGDIKLDNYMDSVFWFLKYKWIYAGTFFWLYPNKINQYIQENVVDLEEGYGRYYAEGFLGKIFASNDGKCKSIHRAKGINETNKEFLSSFTEFEKIMFNILYNKIEI